MRRLEGGSLYLYPADDSRGWTHIRIIPFNEGLKKVAEGKFILHTDANGEPWYFQIRANNKTEEEIPGGIPSPTAITAHESMLNAGLFGCSATYDLNESQRMTRIAEHDSDKYLPPEDEIERAQEKVRQWPWPASRIDDGMGEPVYGDRAVRVYPNPTRF